jgi:hypothetical protein
MPKQWFANKGQVIQIVLAVIACAIAAVKTGPSLKANDWLSEGSILFYFLVALVVVSVLVWILSVRKLWNAQRGHANPDPAIRSELERLNVYQTFALRQLAISGGMTGEQFEQRYRELGFPVATLAHQREIAKIFEELNHETTLLTRDASGVWHLRNRDAVAATMHI